LAQPVIPDILMRALPQGGWIVELNADTLPRVLVNNRYLAEVSRATRSKAEKDYLSERLQAANWLVKSLHQRATTILKVAAEIVRQQDAFFRHGVRELRPLILRDIAEAIGMHESTVSRVTSNKYIATPRGLYELKYFFTSAIPGARGGAHSAEAVRHRIRRMVDDELPDATLSDERIVELLRGEGVDIARRTVAKYRESMRIPSSVARRREKLLEL
jgi:RNA polymerase sigma-54 factor